MSDVKERWPTQQRVTFVMVILMIVTAAYMLAGGPTP